MKLSNRVSQWYLLLNLFFVFLAGCTSQKSEPVLFGKDSCHFCKMGISDKRFGAEIVSKKGKVYKFDSIECMYSFKEKSSDELGPQPKIYLVNTHKSGDLIPAEDAYIFEDPQIHSPMGNGYFVAESLEGLKEMIKDLKPESVMRWNDLQGKLATGAAHGH